jgi:hypothetical protein
MEMVLEEGGGLAVALENGDSVVALEGGAGQRLKIAVVALGSGSGSSRRTCNNGIGVSIIKAKGLLLQCWHWHWQGWQERTHPMQGMYVGSNGKEMGVLQRQWRWESCKYDNSIDEARPKGTMVQNQHRQGKGDATMATQQK